MVKLVNVEEEIKTQAGRRKKENFKGKWLGWSCQLDILMYLHASLLCIFKKTLYYSAWKQYS